MARSKKKAAIDQVAPNWSIPTDHSIAVDKARTDHWRAVLNGSTSRIAKTLKAYADLLHIPRTRKTI